MYPLDFEEFLLANNVGSVVIEHLYMAYSNKITIDAALHNRILNLFKLYLIIGGMPEAVQKYIDTKNIYEVRNIQQNLINYYALDASKYDTENKLKIRRIYNMIPSNIDNKVKRIKFKEIENIDDVRYTKYLNEFDYLLNSGIALGNIAVSEPKFPLIQSSSKNLIKLYMNDVGLLTNILYSTNTNVILSDYAINLGAVYETVVCQELTAHNHKLFYYDRKKIGEVDNLIENFNDLTIVPLEIKSGKDYTNFRALPKLIDNNIVKYGYLLSNNKEIKEENSIIHLPIYFIMFI